MFVISMANWHKCKYLSMALNTFVLMSVCILNAIPNWCYDRYCEKALFLIFYPKISFQIIMLVFAFMACRLDVHHVLNRMPILVGRDQINFGLKCWFISFVSMSFVISRSFTKFWAEVWVLAMKKRLRIQGRWHRTHWKSPQSHGGNIISVTRWL